MAPEELDKNHSQKCNTTNKASKNEAFVYEADRRKRLEYWKAQNQGQHKHSCCNIDLCMARKHPLLNLDLQLQANPIDYLEKQVDRARPAEH